MTKTTMTTKVFNNLLSTIQSNDKDLSEQIQKALDFVFEQATVNDNLSPIKSLLDVVGSSRTNTYKKVLGYIRASLSNIAIDKEGSAKKKTKGVTIEFNDNGFWWDFEIKKRETTAKKVDLNKRISTLIKTFKDNDASLKYDKKTLIKEVEVLVSIINSLE